MKHFFMEYGKIIVVGALTITGLMFTTPFAEAVTGSVANFTSGFSTKNDKGINKVKVGLPKPIIDGTNVILTDKDNSGSVSKGDTLTFSRSYLYSGDNTGPTQFLVLKSDGATAELLAKTSIENETKYNETSETIKDLSNSYIIKYEGTTLDTLLNETYYNTISENVKELIQPKEIIQYHWEEYGNTPSHDLANLSLNSQFTVFRRFGYVEPYFKNVYALDLQDIKDYIGGSSDARGTKLNTIFFGISSSFDETLWLRSAYRVIGSTGQLKKGRYNNLAKARPAFVISLYS